MKKIFTFLFLGSSLLSCNEEKKSTPESAYRDSFDKKVIVDSLVRNRMKDAVLNDTLMLSLAPVKIISAKPREREYSNYMDVQVTYQNIGTKDIAAVKFQWTGENAFGDPADMGSGFGGFGGGFDDDKLKVGKKRTSHWSVLSRDLKKVTKAWPTEVVYTDGTKWKLNN